MSKIKFIFIKFLIKKWKTGILKPYYLCGFKENFNHS